MAVLANVPKPEIPIAEPVDPISNDEYRQRIAATQALFESVGIDILVVYGDREHVGDLLFLTGADPRFEEGIYILGPTGMGTILLGNENWDQWPPESLGIDVILYQELSPVGQKRDEPVQLKRLLAEAGVEPGTRVGVAGAKRLSEGYIEDPEVSFAVPSYLIDTVRELSGSRGKVVNAEQIFSDPETGVRVVSSAHQLAEFEYGASVVSASVASGMAALEVGASEHLVADALFDRGIPHSCHTMVAYGPKQGMYSATGYRAELGDAFTLAQGLRGGLSCRAGSIAHSVDDLSAAAREVFPDQMLNYFDVVSTWHETVKIGALGGEVFDAVNNKRSLFEFLLDPGHQLHYDEFNNTYFKHGNTTKLRSGMMIQCDIIPVMTVPNTYVNIEDGVALADAELRTQLQNEYPQLWERVVKRRAYLTDVIGVNIDESLLPMSNTPLWHTPYALDQSLAFTQ